MTGQSRESLAGVCLLDFQGVPSLSRQFLKVLTPAPSQSLGEELCTFKGVVSKESEEQPYLGAAPPCECPALGHVLTLLSLPQPLRCKDCSVGLLAASTQEVQEQSAGLRRV